MPRLPVLEKSVGRRSTVGTCARVIDYADLFDCRQDPFHVGVVHRERSADGAGRDSRLTLGHNGGNQTAPSK